MAIKTKIGIPEPCNKDWNNMTQSEKGRFCTNCQKNVYDFTRSGDREIIGQLHNSPNICGRFLPSQLGRELRIPEGKSRYWAVAMAGMIALLKPVGNELYAQGNQHIQQTDNRSDIISGPPADKMPDQITISGVVCDQMGTLPGAHVLVKGTEIATQTDIDGNFRIAAQENDVLVISFVGFTDYEFVVPKNSGQPLKIQLPESLSVVGEIIRTRSFVGRSLLFIGNLFRREENKRY